MRTDKRLPRNDCIAREKSLAQRSSMSIPRGPKGYRKRLCALCVLWRQKTRLPYFSRPDTPCHTPPICFWKNKSEYAPQNIPRPFLNLAMKTTNFQHGNRGSLNSGLRSQISYMQFLMIRPHIPPNPSKSEQIRLAFSSSLAVEEIPGPGYQPGNLW